jgi:hypothetical protein
MYRLIKVTFANVTKDRAYAEIAIDNTKSRVLLSIFEGGGEKQPFKGQNVAVPITGEAARPSFGDPVQDAYTFKNLNFKKVSLTQQGQAAALLHGLGLVKLKKNKLSNNAFIWEGDHRTFILPHSAGAPNGGVFQRIGPGRDDVRMIYSFKRDPKLKKMLGFVDLANEVYQREFTKNFMDAYNSGRS